MSDTKTREVVDALAWDALLAEFAVYQRAGNLREKTIQNRQECLLMLAQRSGVSPTQVTKGDLLGMMTRLHFRSGEPLAPGTKQAERSYLKAFFGWLLESGYRKDDPSRALPKVKIPRRRPRPFRLAQVEALLDSGAYSRTRDIITLGALSGLRIGEIVKLRGEDFDLDGGVVYSLRKGGVEHTIPLHPALAQMAKRYPRSGWWFPAHGPNRQFPNGGGHILMESASDAVSKAIRRAGITDRRITGHSLRHYYATQLLAEGASIRIIQEMLGHASLATTQLYAEVSDQQMQDAVALLGGLAERVHSNRGRKSS